VTPQAPKILFDECIGRPHIQHLANFVAISDEATAEIKHVLDFQPQGVWDETWIPRIKDEGWVVITQDKSRFSGGKGTPLSRVCLANGITHVIFSRRIGERRSFNKMMTVLNVWYEIIAIAQQPRGQRYVLEPLHQQDDRTHGRLLLRMPATKQAPDRLFGAAELSLATSALPPAVDIPRPEP
jgi:hypothetical protein